MINLILNAVDAMPGGDEIEIATEAIDNTVRLTVGNEGIGLSTVHGSVHRWGGTIDIESEVGIGTRFVVDLPESQLLGEQDLALDSQIAVSRRARVLIIEDEPFVVEFLSRILGPDHDLTVLDDGDRAVTTFVPDIYDLALIDLGLPGRPGDQVAEEIARRDPKVIRVLVTGWYLQENDNRLEPLDLHIQKPISGAEQARNIFAQALARRIHLLCAPRQI